MRNLRHFYSGLLPLILAAVISLSGCVTNRDIDRLSVDNLEMLPEGADVIVTTTDGREIRIKVTGSGHDHVDGIDRHFRQYHLERDDIRTIRGRPQNDLVVALAFFAVVFVTGF